MKPHVRIYMQYFGYDIIEDIFSEVSGSPAVDVHHILPKSLGGKDKIINLIALTRDEHDRAHSDPEYNARLKEVHLKFMEYNAC